MSITMAKVLTVVWAVSAVAAATPFPQFTGKRLYVTGDVQAYAAVEAKIAEIEANSRQTYYVVVVPSAGEGSSATRNYTDALYQAWKREAAAGGLKLDTERAVIIVLAQENRQLAVHGGSRLQAAYGFAGDTIDRELVVPHFVPHAKAGNYPEGLLALLTNVETWLQAHEAQAPVATVAQPPAAGPPATPAESVAPAVAEGRELVGAKLAEAPVPVARPPMFATRTETHLSVPSAAHRSTAASFPVALSLGLGLALLVVAVQRWRHTRSRQAAAERLREYKEQVMQLSSSLDALRERHAALPTTDPDFQQPMAGDTLQLYESVRTALESLREHWLQLMDAWEQAESTLKREWWLGMAQSREAQRLLAAAAAPRALERVVKQCTEPLNRLEQAHETAAKALADAAAESARLDEQKQSLTALGVDPQRIEAESQARDVLLAQTNGLLVADPIRMQALLSQAHDRAAEFATRCLRLIELFAAARQVEQDLQQARQLVAQKRQQGLLLRETSADPDPRLNEATEQQARGLQLLKQADASAGAELIERARNLTQQALAAVQAHEKARADSAQQLPARRAEQDRLRPMLQQAQADRAQLSREFAAPSWQGVAGHADAALAQLARIDAELEQAARQAATDVQHYGAAIECLNRVTAAQQQTATALAAVGNALRDLTVLRTACQTRLRECQTLTATVGELLRTHSADRPRSNQQYQSACDATQRLRSACALPQADWPQLSARLDEALSEFRQAEQLAREDMRLADQARAEIGEAEREFRRIQGFNRLGFSATAPAAERALVEARERLVVQAYEESIALAQRATQSARQAEAEAIRQADARQAELDRQRREQEQQQQAAAMALLAATHAATQAAAAQQQAAQQQAAQAHAALPTHFTPPPAHDTGTSSTSFPTGTSQTSW